MKKKPGVKNLVSVYLRSVDLPFACAELKEKRKRRRVSSMNCSLNILLQSIHVNVAVVPSPLLYKCFSIVYCVYASWGSIT